MYALQWFEEHVGVCGRKTTFPCLFVVCIDQHFSLYLFSLLPTLYVLSKIMALRKKLPCCIWSRFKR